MMHKLRLLVLSGLLLLCCLGTVQAAGTGMIYVTNVTDINSTEPGTVHLYLDNRFDPPAAAYNVRLIYDDTVISYVDGVKKNATNINPTGNVITINGIEAIGYPAGPVWLADLRFGAVADPPDGGSSSVNITVNTVGDTDITDVKANVTVRNGTVTTRDEVAPNVTIATPTTVSSTFNVAGTIHDVGGMGTAIAYLDNGTVNETVDLMPLTRTAADTWTFDTAVTWPVYEPVTIKISATDVAGNTAVPLQTKVVQVSEVGFSDPEPTGYINRQPDKIQVFTRRMNPTSVTMTLTGPATIPLDVTFDGDYAQNISVPTLADGTWYVNATGTDTPGGNPRYLNWSFVLDTVPPVINAFTITDTDGDGYLESGEVLNFNWDVSGAGVVLLMDNVTHEVFFASTDAIGTNHTTIDVGNRDMVFVAFDEAANAAYVPFHLYYNYMAWINSTRIGTVSGIDTNLSAVRQLDLTAQGSVVFYNARDVPSVPIGTVKRTATGVGQVTSDTYVAVDNTVNATYTGADTYDCVWTYNPCSDLDFLVQAPNINAANIIVLEANESYLAQLAREGESARDTINYNDLIQKEAWIFIDGGYTKIKVNPDGTFTQPEKAGNPLIVAASGNIIDTLRIADNQVNLTAGYCLGTQGLPVIKLPAGDFALVAISMDGDRIGVITGMPFTVMECAEVGTVPASVTRGTPFTAAFPSECDRIGTVVIRHATWDADVWVNASTINHDSVSVNLTYDGVPATQHLYHNIYTSPNAAAYAYATNASSVSVPTDNLCAGTYDVHLVAVCEENGTVRSYGYHQIAVQNPCAPVAAFSADPMTGFAPLTVNFTDESTGHINTWYWEFGDGTTCWNPNPALHTFKNPGTYQVNLTVWGYGGSSTTSKQIVVISPTPVANFSATPKSGNAPLTVTFTDRSTGNITAWAWEFGDGSTCGNQNPSPHTYNATGTYQVNLTVTGPDGSNTASTVITVTDVAAPIASFTATPTSGYAPLTVTFTDKSVGNITSRFWDFGDGTNCTQENPTHVFNSVGTYTVGLTVTGPGGANATSTTITVRKRSSGGSGGGGGRSSPPTQPIGPSAPVADLWAAFALNGANFTTTDGTQTFSIDLDEAGRIKIEGDIITFKKNGLIIEILASDLKKTGNTIIGTVKSVKVRADPLETEVEGLGNVSARFTADFPSFPLNGTLHATLVENVTENVSSAYSLALLDKGFEVSEIAYTMKVVKKGIGKSGPATITMTVPPEWVTARGGVEQIRILRLADDGTTQVLETVFKGYDANGHYIFEAVSPDGLSEIGLVAVTASTGVTVRPTDVGVGVETPPTLPAGETPTDGGLPVGVIAVLLVAIVAIAAVGYYLQKKE
ncbi:PKD domain-containing protein [Methanofollis aquaemaris]|uniref:PKD domain-containing protein n=1 Tax=Methanofollis aquaemaris TaxID=126734 RepID=A0A8A3S5T1_9EURY|nr:PKD domain-containing protein [Methanofollis aquaemaris]QSZ67617.1 PKD domain-containing protein [Methanofollis aquaemaris]